MSNIETCHFNLDFIAGTGGDGWNDAWGEEQIHRLVVPMVQPEDTVLDLFAGWGRGSVPLAMYGAEVTAVDVSGKHTQQMIEAFTDAGLSSALFEIIVQDALELTPKETGLFNFAVAIDAITHIHKSDGLDFIQRMPEFLIPGGVIALTAPSTLSDYYEWLKQYAEQVDNDTYLDMCPCSGDIVEEPFAFYHPGEIEVR